MAKIKFVQFIAPAQVTGDAVQSYYSAGKFTGVTVTERAGFVVFTSEPKSAKESARVYRVPITNVAFIEDEVEAVATAMPPTGKPAVRA